MTGPLEVLRDHAGAPVIVAVHDADTMRLLLIADEEYGLGQWPWLRLTHPECWVDGYELYEPGGPEAAAWVADTLRGAADIQVTLYDWSFSRRVAAVTVDGRDLAEWLVASGHARWSE